MVERALRASPDGIKAAKTALIGFRLTQQQLANALGVTRQPISKFFNGKPVACELFVRICEKLKLDWQAIAQKDDELEGEQNRNEGSDIDALVQEIREKVKPNIRERCGTMRVLDMTQPIELTGERGIYTNVNILEKITGRRRLGIAELLQNRKLEDFEKKLLQQYYTANKLLVDCLNSDCSVSQEVRHEIEDTLLLPMAEIEKRQQGSVG